MSAVTIGYLVILGVCTLASGFFSGSETALIGLGKERVHQMHERGRRGQRVQQLLSDPDRLLSTLLVANNLVNILGAAVATTLFITMLGESLGPWIATAAVTTVVLIFGEITPKSLATRYPEEFSLAVAPGIYRMSLILNPVARFFIGITRGLFRLFRVDANGGVSAVTEADIKALAELGLAEGEIEEVEQEIIDALFDLADRPVREAMTPRVDLATLSSPITMDMVRSVLSETGHSRYPVTSGYVDGIQGVLYVKDVIQLPESATSEDIEMLVRAPHVVVETAPILQVLQDMRHRRYGFALVVDEHGGVDGIVTIKDVVAELVGELQDEYDPGIPTVVQIDAGRWLTDGRLPLEDLKEEIGHAFPDGPYSTAAGLFLALAGHIPDDGDQVLYDGYELTVVGMDRNRIDRIRIDEVTTG
jgi:putative hemolysin